ncbi:phosphatase 2C-like domain-containing protein [Pilobolus umbonatus]|nr:phosphatase 2C-like domain-containing protein [Pilobolus umbonatus]
MRNNWLSYIIHIISIDNGSLRINLDQPSQLLGICSSRGTRTENEDQCRAVTLELPSSHTLPTMDREANRAYFGIFDGHGGPFVSEWLANHLHEIIETTTLNEFHQSLSFLRAYNGYFRRFPIPSLLRDCMDAQGNPRKGIDVTELSLEQRITLAFLSADTECLKQLKEKKDGDNEGSTGSIAIIEPADHKSFWDSHEYSITIGHVGDTRILLCDSTTGAVRTLTTGDHHPGNPIETERLRKYAGFVTTDSWGDERIMGMLATSRAFGDAKLKRYGVSAEPDTVRYEINQHNPAAFMVLITDGISAVISNQEIIDIVKQYKDPLMAAKKIVDTADQLQSDDNTTAMVIRLKDWGKVMRDYTSELRKYRLENVSMSNRQAW